MGMDLNNDYIGSFAQENVLFSTMIEKTSVYGDNYWKAMVFVEKDRFVNVDPDLGWEEVKGSGGKFHAIVVDAFNYTSFTTGLLTSWLSDLFGAGNPHPCILVSIGEKAAGTAALTTNLTEAYNLLKAYAYWKTVCIGGDTADALTPELFVKLTALCHADNNITGGEMLSGPVPVPYEEIVMPSAKKGVLFEALETAGFSNHSCFFVAYDDNTRNAALYCLGLALSGNPANPVGENFDMIATSGIMSSGKDGTGLDKPIRDAMHKLHIGTFKPVGDNSGNVACEGGETANGDIIPATWVLAYVTFMTKVGIAKLVTTRGFYHNAENYSKCVSVLQEQLSAFALRGTLKDLLVTPPAYKDMPKVGQKKFAIPNAWRATYVDHVREVSISGTMVFEG